MYEVIVSTVTDKGLDGQQSVEVYRQSVEELDLKKIIAAVNSKPRKARAPKVAPQKP